MLPSHSLNGYQLGLNTLFIDLVECNTHTHTNQILPTDTMTSSTFLKFGHGSTLCVCMESCWGMNLKHPTNLKRTNGLV